jgi:hypothetical protein
MLKYSRNLKDEASYLIVSVGTVTLAASATLLGRWRYINLIVIKNRNGIHEITTFIVISNAATKWYCFLRKILSLIWYHLMQHTVMETHFNSFS